MSLNQPSVFQELEEKREKEELDRKARVAEQQKRLEEQRAKEREAIKRKRELDERRKKRQAAEEEEDPDRMPQETRTKIDFSTLRKVNLSELTPDERRDIDKEVEESWKALVEREKEKTQILGNAKHAKPRTVAEQQRKYFQWGKGTVEKIELSPNIGEGTVEQVVRNKKPTAEERGDKLADEVILSSASTADTVKEAFEMLDKNGPEFDETDSDSSAVNQPHQDQVMLKRQSKDETTVEIDVPPPRIADTSAGPVDVGENPSPSGAGAVVAEALANVINKLMPAKQRGYDPSAYREKVLGGEQQYPLANATYHEHYRLSCPARGFLERFSIQGEFFES